MYRTFFLTPLVLLFSPFAFTAEGSFLTGVNFTAVPIQGQVTVYCAEGASAGYSCRDTALEPVSYDYFVGPQGVVADQVLIRSSRADGSVRERVSEYDASAGRSKEAFNLWISTPFQRPLLQTGSNKVDFTMKSHGQTLSQGEFTVMVRTGAARECPSTHYNSAEAIDCQSQYTVCQRYFEQFQNCR